MNRKLWLRVDQSTVCLPNGYHNTIVIGIMEGSRSRYELLLTLHTFLRPTQASKRLIPYQLYVLGAEQRKGSRFLRKTSLEVIKELVTLYNLDGNPGNLWTVHSNICSVNGLWCAGIEQNIVNRSLAIYLSLNCRWVEIFIVYECE